MLFRGEKGIGALLWHPLSPGADAGSRGPKAPSVHAKGPCCSPQPGKVSRACCSPSEMCPQFSKVYLTEHQALIGRRVDDANHRGTHEWLPLPKTSLQQPGGLASPSLCPHCLGEAGVTLPLFSPSTLCNVCISHSSPETSSKIFLILIPWATVRVGESFSFGQLSLK